MKITLDKKLSLFFLLIIIVILNFIIFVPKFIYGDEAWSAKVSSFGLIDAIKNSLNDFHPPLYHIFLSLILYIIPHNETFLKFLSLLFGILTIYIILFKLNEFIGEEESKILSILLAISPTFLYIFTLVRMYSLSIFLMTLSILFFFKILKSENKKDKILYIISNILMMLTHHLTVPLFFIEGLYLIIKKRWSLLKTFILNLFIYLPFSYIFLIQLKRRMELSRGWGNIFIESFFKDFFSYLFLNIKDASIFIILNFLILIFIGLYKNLIKFKEDKTFFVLFFLIYFIMFFVVTKLLGSLYFHYILLIIIPSYLLLVEGSFFLKKYKEKVLIFIIIILFSFTPMSFIKGYPEVSQIKTLINNKKAVFLNRYEMYRYTFNLNGDFEFIADLPLNNFTFDTQKKIDEAINFIENEKPPFYFIYSQVGSDLLSLYDPKGKIKRFLEEKTSSKTTHGIYSDSTVIIYYLEPMN